MTASAMTDPSPAIEPDLYVEAQRLLAEIERRQLAVRLIGGMAIRLLAAERMHPAYQRSIQDLDFMLTKRDRRGFEELLVELGYSPRREFNALNGARRLLFDDPVNGRQIDVFVETFAMCHPLPLTQRIEALPHTLPPAEILMTKLQIVELNEKDRSDLFALLHSHEVTSGDPRGIELAPIVDLTSGDWALQHTFELNVARLRDALGDQPFSPEEASAVAGRIEALAAAMDGAPKSRRWKLRAKVGERKLWYDDPEEVER
jgi:hypothetical protein